MTRFEIGANHALQIRRTHFSHPTKRASILYVSDLHLNGNTGHVSRQILEAIEQVRLNIVLLGGDMVDRARGLDELEAFVRRVAGMCPVAAVPGNHDALVGIRRVRASLEAGGALWLGEQGYRLSPDIQIDGVCRPHQGRQDFPILCAHHPAVFHEAASRGYRLVLAGHLHGGQCVLGSFRGRLYPGALISRWNGDVFQNGPSTMLVSRGVNDTIPVRWCCPREVLVCEIGQ